MMLQIFKLMMHIFEGNIKFQKLQNLSLRNHNLNDLQSCPKPTNEHFSLIIYYKKKMIRSNYTSISLRYIFHSNHYNENQ